jgi:DNA-directed RNA polymerase subunit N (RpoN/RPB10)
MACPIQCYTCGKDLAELHPAFEALSKKHISEDLRKSKVDATKYGIVENETNNIVYIFDYLNIKNMCCRIRIRNFRDDDLRNYEHVNSYKL